MAVASRDAAKARTFAQQHGLAHATDRIDDLEVARYVLDTFALWGDAVAYAARFTAESDYVAFDGSHHRGQIAAAVGQLPQHPGVPPQNCIPELERCVDDLAGQNAALQDFHFRFGTGFHRRQSSAAPPATQQHDTVALLPPCRERPRCHRRTAEQRDQRTGKYYCRGKRNAETAEATVQSKIARVDQRGLHYEQDHPAEKYQPMQMHHRWRGRRDRHRHVQWNGVPRGPEQRPACSGKPSSNARPGWLCGV